MNTSPASNAKLGLSPESENSEKTKGKQREKRLSPEERRLAIMAAAKDLFLSRGFSATSLEDIVAVSGGSLSTVYQLFGNKQGLFQALVNAATQQVTAPLLEAMTHHGEPREVLKAFAARLDALERSPDASGAFRLMMAEGGKYPELAQTLFDTGPDASRQVVVNYLNAEVMAGTLKIPDVDLATEQFASMVCSDTKLRNACGVAQPSTRDDVDRRLESIVDMFLRAYGA